jgi:hypothetical protein
MFRLNRVNISYIMTRRSKEDCIEAAINLSVVVASTGAIDGQDRLALLFCILLKLLIPTINSI